MSAIEKVVYYSLYGPRNRLGTAPIPIHSAPEKVQAEAAALQTVELPWGKLRFVLFVCDPIDDVTIEQWMNWLKGAYIGTQPQFVRSRYWENDRGAGFVE